MDKKEENKICMNCGKCCQSYWIFTDVPEEVERFNTLSPTFVEVIKIKDGLWKIMFHLKCNHLKHNTNGTIECMIYNKDRPKYCSVYPRNFLEKNVEKEVLENEINFCSLLKNQLRG